MGEVFVSFNCTCLYQTIPQYGSAVWSNSGMPTIYFPSQMTAVCSHHLKLLQRNVVTSVHQEFPGPSDAGGRLPTGFWQLPAWGFPGGHFLWSQSGRCTRMLGDWEVMLTDKPKAKMLSFLFSPKVSWQEIEGKMEDMNIRSMVNSYGSCEKYFLATNSLGNIVWQRLLT